MQSLSGASKGKSAYMVAEALDSDTGIPNTHIGSATVFLLSWRFLWKAKMHFYSGISIFHTWLRTKHVPFFSWKVTHQTFWRPALQKRLHLIQNDSRKFIFFLAQSVCLPKIQVVCLPSLKPKVTLSGSWHDPSQTLNAWLVQPFKGS